jgi:hypothetical protein
MWRIKNGKRFRKQLVITNGFQGVEVGDAVKFDGRVWRVQSVEPTAVWNLGTANARSPEGSANAGGKQE